MSAVLQASHDDEPPTLRRWRVMVVVSRSGAHSRHVYGHDVTSDTGVVSSAIGAYDLTTMTATTRSGRKYRLAGVPGRSRVGEYVWEKWCRINGIVSQVDVTEEYFNANLFFSRVREEGKAP